MTVPSGNRSLWACWVGFGTTSGGTTVICWMNRMSAIENSLSSFASPNRPLESGSRSPAPATMARGTAPPIATPVRSMNPRITPPMALIRGPPALLMALKRRTATSIAAPDTPAPAIGGEAFR